MVYLIRYDFIYRSDLTDEERQLLATIRRRKAELIEEIETIRNELAQVNTEIESLDIVDDEWVIRINNRGHTHLEFVQKGPTETQGTVVGS